MSERRGNCARNLATSVRLVVRRIGAAQQSAAVEAQAALGNVQVGSAIITDFRHRVQAKSSPRADAEMAKTADS